MNKPAVFSLLLTVTTLTFASITSRAQNSGPDSTWYAYGGDAGGTRYASLDQITPKNVKHLEVA